MRQPCSAKYYLPYRAALDLFYRYYTDTWGIRANTLQLGYTQPWNHWIFDGSLRYYQQNAANFYNDIFPRANAQNFEARDRELAAFSSYTVGVCSPLRISDSASAPGSRRTRSTCATTAC